MRSSPRMRQEVKKWEEKEAEEEKLRTLRDTYLQLWDGAKLSCFHFSVVKTKWELKPIFTNQFLFCLSWMSSLIHTLTEFLVFFFKHSSKSFKNLEIFQVCKYLSSFKNFSNFQKSFFSKIFQFKKKKLPIC